MAARPPSRAEVALSLLETLRGRDSGLVLDDYTHSLQTATRAERAGADHELVVAALLHDVGKAVTTRDHDRVAAEMLAGSVRPEIVWMVGVHQDFTAIVLDSGRGRWARYRHVLHPGYRLAKRFVADWDLPSRDPDYETLPVEHFVPLVHEVLAANGREPGSDPRRRRWRSALSRLPEPLADRIHRVTVRPRGWVVTRLRGRR